MNLNDYPNLNKVQSFGKDPNRGKVGRGILVFTRSSLGRMANSAIACAAAITGMLYICNSINAFGENKKSKNGK